MLTAPYSLPAVARTEAAAQHVAYAAETAARRSLRAEARREVAASEWRNLLEMAALPGRRVPVATVRRMGRAAGLDAATVAAAVVSTGAV